MITCNLIRLSESDQGIWGVFLTPGNQYYIIELPWRNNLPCFSCIPKGKYEVFPKYSKRHGHIYHIQNVTNRTLIYIHSGNYAGDTKKGFKTHSLGCILPGLDYGYFGKQRVVLSSRIALRRLKEDLDYQPFVLEVT